MTEKQDTHHYNCNQINHDQNAFGHQMRFALSCAQNYAIAFFYTYFNHFAVKFQLNFSFRASPLCFYNFDLLMLELFLAAINFFLC